MPVAINPCQDNVRQELVEMILKYFAAWFPVVILAIANGALREFAYKPLVGELPAHWLSSISLIFIVGAYLWAVGLRWRIESKLQAWQIGWMWLAMTIGFEFGFGHYVMGHPWAKLFHDYNIVEGRVWVLVLIAILTEPVLLFRWRQRRSAPAH